MRKLRFGIFMPPWNSPASQNVTVSLQRNMETIQLIDDLAYDEAWVGEHHSAGAEVIAEPMMFLTHVGARTRYIKLGTGAVSLPYHNPLWVADRAILADHLLRGRFMLGVGPGSLATDAAMIGLDPSVLRPALDHDLGIVLKLLTTDERLSLTTDRYRLVDARCQLAPYSDPLFDVCVMATASKAGPLIAGRHGCGMLSTGITAPPDGPPPVFHWDTLEEEATANGHKVDRSKWRLVVNMHIAETKKQAIEDMRYGFDAFCDYTYNVLPLPTIRAPNTGFDDRISWINDTGAGVIGTPDEAIAFIKRLQEQAGDFGAIIMLAHDWANWEATKRHYELFARHVIPHFQPSYARLMAAEDWARKLHPDIDKRNGAAIQAWMEKRPDSAPPGVSPETVPPPSPASPIAAE